MDRIDAMKVFIAVLDEGSLAGAGRKVGRSQAAVSRAITFLETHARAELLHRTTRSFKLSQAGEHYAAVFRRILTELAEVDDIAAGEQSAPRGAVMLTAPVDTGDLIQPIIDGFADAYPAVSMRLYLLDKQVNLIAEGADVALRMGRLADSRLTAIRVGEVRNVVVAAPRYLARHPRIEKLADLSGHQIIATAQFGVDSWSFPPLPGSSVPRTVAFTPRSVINRSREAVASAVAGHGLTRVFSHRIAEYVQRGDLEIVLAREEFPPLPVHLISPRGRLSVPKVRAFADFAVPRLRRGFERLTKDLGDTTMQTQRVCDPILPGLNVRPRLHDAKGIMTGAAASLISQPGIH